MIHYVHQCQFWETSVFGDVDISVFVDLAVCWQTTMRLKFSFFLNRKLPNFRNSFKCWSVIPFILGEYHLITVSFCVTCQAGWWFQICFIFIPYLGKVPILTNIFQMGWNHQLASCWRSLGTNFNQSLEHLTAPMLEVLQLGARFDQPLSKLPGAWFLRDRVWEWLGWN